MFLKGMQPHWTTLFGVPFPHPTPQGRRDQTLRKVPEAEFESCTRQPSGQRGCHGKPMDKGVPRTTLRPSPSISIFQAICTSQPWIQLAGGYARWHHLRLSGSLFMKKPINTQVLHIPRQPSASSYSILKCSRGEWNTRPLLPEHT